MLNFIPITNVVSEINIEKIEKGLNIFFDMSQNDFFRNCLYLDNDFNVSSVDIMLKVFEKDKSLREAIYELEESIDGIKDIGLIRFLVTDRKPNQPYEVSEEISYDTYENLDDKKVELEFDMSVLLRIFKKYNLVSSIREAYLLFGDDANQFLKKLNSFLLVKRFNNKIYVINDIETSKTIYSISFWINGKQFSLESEDADFMKSKDFKKEFVKSINKNFNLEMDADDAIKDFNEFLKTLALMIY